MGGQHPGETLLCQCQREDRKLSAPIARLRAGGGREVQAPRQLQEGPGRAGPRKEETSQDRGGGPAGGGPTKGTQAGERGREVATGVQVIAPYRKTFHFETQKSLCFPEVQEDSKREG